MTYEQYLVIKVGRVSFYAKHWVLQDVCRMIGENIDSKGIDNEINVYMGVHEWILEDIPRSIINLGVQTEQFYDSNGKRLWASRSPLTIFYFLSKFDYVLDWSESNRVSYFIDIYKNIFFGPYLFPSTQCFMPRVELFSIFFGAINDRRKQLIEKHSEHYQIETRNGKPYKELRSDIERCDGVINFHFQDGVYVEWPRFLMAYLGGKVLISERLGAPLVPGRHYDLIGGEPYFVEDDNLKGDLFFKNINKDIVEPFGFTRFLVENIRGKRKCVFRSLMVYFLDWLYRAIYFIRK